MKNRVISLTMSLIFASIVLCLFIPTTAYAAEEVYLYNPYEQVDWENTEQFRSNIHTHTQRSDGSMLPDIALNTYAKLGYEYLAITDHNKGLSVDTDLTEEGLSLILPKQTSVVIPLIAGNELSYLHHTLSLFTDFQVEADQYSDEFTLMKAATKYQNGEGRFVIAHPGRYIDVLSQLDDSNAYYNLAFYTDMYTMYPTIIGLEVYNQDDRYSSDRKIYDRILTELMPYRPVWATCDDDNHGNHTGYNCILTIQEEYTEQAYKTALERGQFFSVAFGKYDPARLDEREGGRFNYTPKVNKVIVDRDAHTITLDCEKYTRIEWITANGEVVSNQSSIDYTQDGVSKYLRAQLYYEENGIQVSTLFVQPFGIGEYHSDSWYFYFDNAHKGGCNSSVYITILPVCMLAVALLLIIRNPNKKEI